MDFYADAVTLFWRRLPVRSIRPGFFRRADLWERKAGKMLQRGKGKLSMLASEG